MEIQEMSSAGRQSGFTLVELMIVTVIIAILAAIALPIYRSQIQQSQRTDAKDALLNLASRQERYFTLNNQYATSLTSLGYSSSLVVGGQVALGSSSIPDYYLSIVSASASAYSLQAAPNAASIQASDSCGTYTLDNLGNQGNTGTSGSSNSTNCW